ncbi:general substrate transporter [Cokeromyces recurvatus]|uniref:general substrate transporter n=1 Tax=Cokeromyces recurvatus TaxID=90255 RepID=UPI0022200D98|nr:general substrate transporter [Cokeromyces recurvatus]KAI7900852.1 general substrate transporter [Cokeromyces recurvatus]
MVATNEHYERIPSSEDSSETQLAVDNKERGTIFVYCLVFCICIGGFLFGYDTGVISGALQPIQKDFIMSIQQQEWIVGATTLGAIFGGFFAGFPLVLYAAFIFIIGSCSIAFASSYNMLLIGRLIVGLGVGIASMITPVYISEISPKSLRGHLATINTFVITFGQVFAYIVNIIYSKKDNGWRYMFGIGAIPAIIQLIMMPFMPESPRRMIAENKLVDAKEILQKIYGSSVSEQFIDYEIENIQKNMLQNDFGSYRSFLEYHNLKPLLIACMLQAAQQLSGFNTVMYYAATILQMAGFKDHQNSTIVALIVSVTNMIFTIIAVFIIDKVGRRRILIITMLFMIISLFVLGGSFAIQQEGLFSNQLICEDYRYHCSRCLLDSRCSWSIEENVCLESDKNSTIVSAIMTSCPKKSTDSIIRFVLLFSLTVYVASYALGLGYVPWIIQSELFSASLRGKGNGIATATNWICNLVVASTFLSMVNTLSTAGTFWLYASISILLWISIVRWVPETSGKSLEDISSLF